MMKKLVLGAAVAALMVTAVQSEAFAGKRYHGHRGGFDVKDFIEIEHDFEDDGPSCAWIRKQMKRTKSAYWKTRYYDECVGD